MYTKIISKTSIPYSYKESVEELAIRVNTLDYQYVGAQWIAGRVFNRDEPFIYCYSFALNPSLTPLANREYIYIPVEYQSLVVNKVLSYLKVEVNKQTATLIYPTELYRRPLTEEVPFVYKLELDSPPNVPVNIRGYDSLGKYSHPLYPTLFFSGQLHINKKGIVLYEYYEVNDFFYLEGTLYISDIRPKGLNYLIPPNQLNLNYTESITLALGCEQYCNCVDDLINTDSKTKAITVANSFTKGVIQYSSVGNTIASNNYCNVGEMGVFQFADLQYQVKTNNPPIRYVVENDILYIYDSTGLIDEKIIDGNSFNYGAQYYCVDAEEALIYIGSDLFDIDTCELNVINSYPEVIEREYKGFFTGNYQEIAPFIYLFEYVQSDGTLFYSVDRPDPISYSYSHFYANKSLILASQEVEELRFYNEEHTDNQTFLITE